MGAHRGYDERKRRPCRSSLIAANGEGMDEMAQRRGAEAVVWARRIETNAWVS
jgi:hypothetical protein